MELPKKLRVDLTGKRIGKLTVVEFAGRAKDGHALWLCKCDCGNFATVQGNNLTQKKPTVSCGCAITESKADLGIDETGKRYGDLTVIERASDIYGHWAFLCRCECGAEVIKTGSQLRSAKFPSCGCKRGSLGKTHGMAGTRLYTIWFDMKRRCSIKSNKSYKDYGGRGITVCPEWKDSFEAFRDWALTNGYRDDLSIDRKDTNGNYEPTNCQWIPMAEQAKNRRNCHFITCDGRTKTITDWSRETGIDRFEIAKRLKNGQSPAQALGLDGGNG